MFFDRGKWCDDERIGCAACAWWPVKSASQKFMTALADYPDGSLGPHELCLCCVRALPVDRAAIMIGVEATTLEPLGASDEVAARMEAQQLLAGEGPALDAVARGGPVVVDDLAARDDRWPGFIAALGPDARGGLFAYPLQIGTVAVGVLDLYRSSRVLLTSAEVTDMLAVADIVTMVTLTRIPPADTDTEVVDAWWTPSPSSSEIHQATGMVIAQLQVAPRVAFLRLRARAFADGRPLIDLARDVIERRIRFDPGPEPGLER